MDAQDLDALVDLVSDGEVVVLSGAGLSTERSTGSRTKQKPRSGRVQRLP